MTSIGNVIFCIILVHAWQSVSCIFDCSYLGTLVMALSITASVGHVNVEAKNNFKSHLCVVQLLCLLGLF